MLHYITDFENFYPKTQGKTGCGRRKTIVICTLRDLHHEKKPLLVCNFLEYLDESTNLQPVLSRTQSLSRQVLLLTPVDLSGQI